jgi:hypothetical protein
MSKKDKFEKITDRLNKGEFLKFRNYRKRQSDMIAEYWEIVCMILISSKMQNERREYYNPKHFQTIVTSLFDPVFLNKNKTTSELREIPRSVALNRAYWNDNRSVFLALKNDQIKILEETGLILHQSITSSVHSSNILSRAQPKMVSIHVFDGYHQKLKQPVSPILKHWYPQQLLFKVDDDMKLTTGITIREEFIKSYHQIAIEMMIALYTQSLIDRIAKFFEENTEIPLYSEDLLA